MTSPASSFTVKRYSTMSSHFDHSSTIIYGAHFTDTNLYFVGKLKYYNNSAAGVYNNRVGYLMKIPAVEGESTNALTSCTVFTLNFDPSDVKTAETITTT